MVCDPTTMANLLTVPLRSTASSSEKKEDQEKEDNQSSTNSTEATSLSQDEEDEEELSPENSSKSAILSRFLNRLMEPIHPLKYSKSLPSLVPKQIDNVRFRSEALVTEGWILERCIEGTPGRKYNVSGLIVDSDTILATQMKSGRFGFAGGDCFVDRELDADDFDDSASRNATPSFDPPCIYFYLIVFILVFHILWCMYRFCSRCMNFRSNFT